MHEGSLNIQVFNTSHTMAAPTELPPVCEPPAYASLFTTFTTRLSNRGSASSQEDTINSSIVQTSDIERDYGRIKHLFIPRLLTGSGSSSGPGKQQD